MGFKRTVGELGDLRVARLDLWWSPQYDKDYFGAADFQEALQFLTSASTRLPEVVVLHDVTHFDDREIVNLYLGEIAATAVAWNYAVSNLFGTHKFKGCATGIGVPALVIHFVEDATPLVAPHEEWTKRKGVRTVYELHSILTVLKMLNKNEQIRLFGSTL